MGTGIDRRRIAAALGAILLASAIGPGAAAGTLPLLLEQRLGPHVAAALDAPSPADDREVLGRFYAARGWSPIWTGKAASRGRDLAGFLAATAREGLRPADYGADRALRRLGDDDKAAQAELELVLSRGLLAYARHQAEGRFVPRTAEFDVPLAGRQSDPAALLEAAVVAPDLTRWLEGLAPAGDRYRRLVALLAGLRDAAAAGGWTPVPDGEALRPGTSHPAVPALRRRLAETGDLAPGHAVAPARFDPALEAAVRRFQARHGLDADGVVGRATLTALNRDVGWRIVQTELALERLRIGRSDLGERYIHVNIPDYHLTFVDRLSDPAAPVRYDARVVVGTVLDQTPTFTGSMTYLELNPNWHVPRSIATKEFLPQIQKDPAYLERNNYVLLAKGEAVDPWSVDWSRVTQGSFPFRIKQRPGAGNALGSVKFMFPNAHNVYIHDTPKKSLFARGQRTFSHGCIRLADPFVLAELLLGRHGWDQARFDAAVAAGRTRVVNLPEPIPVFITYETAWVDEDGSVQFREDIYGRDAALAQRLEISGS